MDDNTGIRKVLLLLHRMAHGEPDNAKHSAIQAAISEIEQIKEWQDISEVVERSIIEVESGE